MPDYLIIGGGIIGTALARELALRKAGKIAVLDKEPALGRHASGRNSGVIHSGINQKPGSLKARMCLEGSRRLREYCRERGVPMNECGTLVVARDQSELGVLERLLSMGQDCGVEGLRILNGRELKACEPAAAGLAALLSPTGATVDSLRLLETLAQEARELGVEYRLGCEVRSIEGREVQTSQGRLRAGHIVNCAGLHADRVARTAGAGLEYQVIPFRGDYMEVAGCGVKTMIYQAPDLRFPFLSIHLTRETDGRVLAGPSAVLAFGREAYDKEWIWKDAAEMFLSPQFWRLAARPDFLNLALNNAKTSFSKKAFLNQVRSLVPGVRMEQLKPARSGIRAQMVDSRGRMVEDIVVSYGEHSTHVLNAVSPGMTCSLAFAGYVVDRILQYKKKAAECL